MDHSPEVWNHTVSFFREQLNALDQYKSQSMAEEIWVGKQKAKLQDDFRTFAQEFKVAQADEFKAKIIGMTVEEAKLFCPSRFSVVACTIDGVEQNPECRLPEMRTVVRVSVIDGRIANHHGFQ